MTPFSILRRLSWHLRRRHAQHDVTTAPEGAVVPLSVDNPRVRAAAAWFLERLMDPHLDECVVRLPCEPLSPFHRHEPFVQSFVTLWPPERRYEVLCACGWRMGPLYASGRADLLREWLETTREPEAIARSTAGVLEDGCADQAGRRRPVRLRASRVPGQ